MIHSLEYSHTSCLCFSVVVSEDLSLSCAHVNREIVFPPLALSTVLSHSHGDGAGVRDCKTCACAVQVCVQDVFRREDLIVQVLGRCVP